MRESGKSTVSQLSGVVMNEHRYSQVVLRELKRLDELALSREQNSRLKDIGIRLNRWKKGGISSSDVLAEINRLSGSSSLARVRAADPGVYAAHAVSAGFLHRKDFSDSAWKAVEVQITLAGI